MKTVTYLSMLLLFFVACASGGEGAGCGGSYTTSDADRPPPDPKDAQTPKTDPSPTCATEAFKSCMECYLPDDKLCGALWNNHGYEKYYKACLGIANVLDPKCSNWHLGLEPESCRVMYLTESFKTSWAASTRCN